MNGDKTSNVDIWKAGELMAVDFVPPVTLDELRQPRSYDEFETWVERIVKSINGNAAAVKWIRLDDRLGKRVREEVFPFRVFARSVLVGKEVRIGLLPVRLTPA